MKEIEFHRFGTAHEGQAKQKTIYGMKLPEGCDHHDSVEWGKDYIGRMYEPDALAIVTQIRALERTDTGYRPVLIESDHDDTISKAEIHVSDLILPDGTPASKCPFRHRLALNKVVSEDFEEYGGELFDQIPDYTAEGASNIDRSADRSTMVLDLTYLNQNIPDE